MIIECEDLEFCREVAWARNETHLPSANERISIRDGDHAIHLKGVMAELAWRRDLGISDEQPWVYEDRDPGYDFVWRGLTVDVKASSSLHLSMEQIKFMIPEYKPLLAELYVMSAIGPIDKHAYMVKPLGGISRQKFRQVHEVGHEFPPFRLPTRWVPFEALTTLKGLKASTQEQVKALQEVSKHD